MQPNQHLRILTISSMLMLVLSIYMVFVYAPLEIVMGAVQRVFYYHVASGWIGALAFLITLICSILYLATRNLKWDHVALSSVEIGVVFTSMNIVSGSVWARPIWNTWWTWDPRLTTATIMWLLYAAYLMLRQSLENPQRRRTFAAVYGIVAFVSVPLTFDAIRIWRTIHPVIIGSSDPSAEGNFEMTPPMRNAFFFSLFTFTFLYVTLLWHRIRLEQLTVQVAAMQSRLLNKLST